VKSGRKKTLFSSTVLAVAAIVLVAGAHQTPASAQSQGRAIKGTWVLSMDTGVFGIPGGVFWGLVIFHQDGTVTIVDGGDLGSAPFDTTDTAQRGAWAQVGRQTFKATTLFLRKDESTGEAEGWHRGRFTLEFDGDGEHLIGFVDEETLACDPGPTPFRLLNCPDPLTSVFTPSPFPIPIKLTRLRAQ